MTKPKRSADELLKLIRERLNGRFSSVKITIERDGISWKAIAHNPSTITRERIEMSVRKVRDLNGLE